VKGTSNNEVEIGGIKMSRLIVKNCVLLLCFLLCWWSPSTSESQRNSLNISDANTLKTSSKLSNNDHLIKILKELFIVVREENVNPQEHELLETLLWTNKLMNLSGIKSISSYWMVDKSMVSTTSEGLVIFQIWKFDDKNKAKWYFDVMKKVVFSAALYEKPPKCFFLVSGTDEMYYFITNNSRNRKYIFRAANQLINGCFPKSEVISSWTRERDE